MEDGKRLGLAVCTKRSPQSKGLQEQIEELIITMPNIGQFEHSIEKYKRIDTGIVAMLSGEASLLIVCLRA